MGSRRPQYTLDCLNIFTATTALSTNGAGKRLCVAAPGFRVLNVAPVQSGTEADPLLFVLQPGNRLTFRAVDRSGAKWSRAKLRVTFPEPMFDDPGHTDRQSPECVDRSWLPPTVGWAALGGTGIEMMMGGTTVLGPRENGDPTFVLTNLLPGKSFSVTLLDTVGNEVMQATAKTPEFGDLDAKIDLHADVSLRSLVVHVMDEFGNPIVNAAVVLGDSREMITKHTDQRGRTTVAGLGVDKVTVKISHPRFAFAQRDLAVTGTPVEVCLQPGRSVRVSVVDAAGKPCLRRFEITIKDVPVQPKLVRVGVFDFQSLPAKRLVVRVHQRGVWREFQLGADVTELRITLD